MKLTMGMHSQQGGVHEVPGSQVGRVAAQCLCPCPLAAVPGCGPAFAELPSAMLVVHIQPV